MFVCRRLPGLHQCDCRRCDVSGTESSCGITDIDNWISGSRLCFNPSKMEIMWLGAGHLLQQVYINVIPVLSSAVKVVQSVHDLGIILVYQVRQIWPATWSLTSDVAKITVQAFIAYCLDWHNPPEKLLRKVQYVQNTAAHLLTNIRRRYHITPVLRQLHWLPVLRKVEFKIAWLAYQCFMSTAAMHLSVDIQLSLSMVTVISNHLPTGHSLFQGCLPLLVTETSLSQDRVCGTVYWLLCTDQWSPATDSLGNIWKCIYLLQQTVTDFCDIQILLLTYSF